MISPTTETPTNIPDSESPQPKFDFSNLVYRGVTQLQKMFEEKRCLNQEPGETYTKMTAQPTIHLYWYLVDKKISLCLQPINNKKPNWATEIQLGDEQKIEFSDATSVYTFRRPIIGITITSQHTESEQFTSLKKAFETALDKIKESNRIDPHPDTSSEVHLNDSPPTETTSVLEKKGNDHNPDTSSDVHLRRVRDDTHSTETINNEVIGKNDDRAHETKREDVSHFQLQNHLRSLWNIIRTSSCFKSCCEDPKED